LAYFFASPEARSKQKYAKQPGKQPFSGGWLASCWHTSLLRQKPEVSSSQPAARDRK